MDSMFCWKKSFCLEKTTKNLFISFIDYKEAFDKREHLIEILNEVGLDYNDIQFIENLYRKQKDSIRWVNMTKETGISKEVGQGCIVSYSVQLVFEYNIQKGQSIGIKLQSES